MVSEVEVQKALSRLYGFRVPLPFAKFVKTMLWIAEAAYPQQQDFCNLNCVNIYFGGYILPYIDSSKSYSNSLRTGRYDQTPLELFPFGGSGIDGIHYGYVVHAPELELSDYPIGEFSPMDGIGVTLIGSDTRSAFEQLLAEALELNLELSCDPGFSVRSLPPDIERQLILDVAETLDISLEALESKEPRDLGFESLQRITPDIPPGWCYENSRDGVGVLAPSRFFDPTFLLHHSNLVAENALEDIRFLLDQDYPASALFVIREMYWDDPRARVFSMLAPLWVEAYSALGRSLLASVVEQELANRIDRFS